MNLMYNNVAVKSRATK